MIELPELYDGMELSTRLLIAEALKRGAQAELLDKSDNFVLIQKGTNVQVVKQATRTSADTYISALAMENKEVTKLLLRRAGLLTPKGKLHTNVQSALDSFHEFRGKACVVKPRSTNFGLGVVILNVDFGRDQWEEAVLKGFELDDALIIEEFAPGLEFRFLVIGGKTRAVLHRIPANVTGNGKDSIRTLVEKKNAHPYRGENYEKPLEKIRLDQTELEFLARQNLSAESVPKDGQCVYLRKNSNISSGGDSVDYTDLMPSRYCRLAEEATQAMGAQIAGVDMIIADYNDASPNAPYSIIEMNFNPALHIHDYPETGTNRKVERHVLDLLGIE